MDETDYLLMPLWAPMQSWGDQVLAGDNRPSLRFPTHSGLSGLIAAALGIDRSEVERLNALHQSLNFISLDCCKGSLQTDFYAVNGFVRAEKLKVDTKSTFIGRKTYMANTAFLVAVYLEKDHAPRTLEKIGKALLFPQFSLYAGRKSHPFQLPPVYHRSGNVPIFRWNDPFQEMIQLREREVEGFSKEEQGQALFKNRRLPRFLSEEDAYFYTEHPPFEGSSNLYQIRDRYVASTLKTRRFDERNVFSFSISNYKTHNAVSD